MTKVVVSSTGSIFLLPYHVVRTLNYDNVVSWDDEWTEEEPDGHWSVDKDKAWILHYYVDNNKLPPKDRYDSYIKIGDDVIVEDPSDEDDAWNHEFVGRIVGFRNDNLVTVEDANGDAFDVETYKLHLV